VGDGKEKGGKKAKKEEKGGRRLVRTFKNLTLKRERGEGGGKGGGR